MSSSTPPNVDCWCRPARAAHDDSSTGNWGHVLEGGDAFAISTLERRVSMMRPGNGDGRQPAGAGWRLRGLFPKHETDHATEARPILGVSSNEFLVPAGDDGGRSGVAGAVHGLAGRSDAAERDRRSGVAVHRQRRRSAATAGDRRRLHDHRRRRSVLHHHRGAHAGFHAVRPATAAQLHARPRQPDRARHVHLDVRLLPAGRWRAWQRDESHRPSAGTRMAGCGSSPAGRASPTSPTLRFGRSGTTAARIPRCWRACSNRLRWCCGACIAPKIAPHCCIMRCSSSRSRSGCPRQPIATISRDVMRS